MSYYEATRDFRLINLPNQLKNPILMRIDINIPLENGFVVENSLRGKVYAHVLELMSDYTGIVVVAHQGRKGGRDFIPLRQHYGLLRKHLPLDVELEFIPWNKIFTEETKEKIRKIDKGKIILLDNIRFFDWETLYNPDKCPFIDFFRGVVNCCVNDAIPVWHRAHTSVMALPRIARTYVGVRSTTELKILHEISEIKNEDKAIVMGGAKFEKANYVLKIAEKIEIFTGGIPGQLMARVKGYRLGLQNEQFLAKKIKGEQVDLARELLKRKVHHPVDFIVLEDGESKCVPISEMKDSKGIIMDIGNETIEVYSEKLSHKEIRIRAGPLGVFEKGFNNGIKLTKRILGHGLVFVGGDTSQELVNEGIIEKIQNTGGVVLLSGGSFIHRLAGYSFPSVEEILKQKIDA